MPMSMQKVASGQMNARPTPKAQVAMAVASASRPAVMATPKAACLPWVPPPSAGGSASVVSSGLSAPLVSSRFWCLRKTAVVDLDAPYGIAAAGERDLAGRRVLVLDAEDTTRP